MQKLTATLPLRAEGEHQHRMPGAFGVEREDWHVEARRSDREVVVSVTARRPRQALEHLAASDDPLDRWFKDRVRALTGEDVTAAFAVALARRTRRLARAD